MLSELQKVAAAFGRRTPRQARHLSTYVMVLLNCLQMFFSLRNIFTWTLTSNLQQYSFAATLFGNYEFVSCSVEITGLCGLWLIVRLDGLVRLKINLICYLYDMIVMYVLEYECGIAYDKYGFVGNVINEKVHGFDEVFYNDRCDHSPIPHPKTMKFIRMDTGTTKN